MHTFTAWILFFYNCLLYALYKIGLHGPLALRDYTPWWQAWLGSVFGWRRNLRVRGMENCPQSHPIIITGNHVRLEDPFCYWVAVFRATGGKVSTHFLMRDDFFQGKPWDWLPFDVDEIARFGGGFPISRGKINLGQLRPILNLLCSPESICMFPGRTRSRTGMLVEYPEGLEEPGSPAFLMAQVQRKNPELQVALLPVCRTWNPVTGMSTMNIGAPRYLAPDAGRGQQRELDHANLLDIAALLELQIAHVVAAALALCAMHGLNKPLPLRNFLSLLEECRACNIHPYLEPALTSGNFEEALREVLLFFQKSGMLYIDGENIHLVLSEILKIPDFSPKFRRENPIRFLFNQALHLGGMCELVEKHVLSWRKK